MNLVTVGAVHTHTHTHTHGYILSDKQIIKACKGKVAGSFSYAQNLIKDG